MSLEPFRMQKKKNIDYALLKKAQGGNQESLCTLTELAREDVLAYLFRLTLDIHVAEDLCQETIVQMLKSLPNLELASEKAFWAWLYKTAFSRISHHFRKQGNTRLHNRTIADSGLLSRTPTLGPSGPEVLMQKEHTTAITEAMNAIKLRYRNILALRCFQDLSYAEIALTTGGTELQARLLFFRAKRSLRYQLASRGFRNKEQLLPALTLFATLTASQSKTASAAAIVNAASLNVSAGIVALGMATTKVGVISMITIATCITAGVVNREAFTSGLNEPMPVYRRVKNEDPNLLNLLQNPDFQRPLSVGKLIYPNDFLWTDRSEKGPSLPDADLNGLLVNKSEPDMHAVILTTGQWINFQFQNPIIDGPGTDIIITGWADPPPLVEVFDSQNQIIPLINPKQLSDTWDRNIFGYDLADLKRDSFIDAVRITGTHRQGPHQGFELNEIRARQP